MAKAVFAAASVLVALLGWSGETIPTSNAQLPNSKGGNDLRLVSPGSWELRVGGCHVQVRGVYGEYMECPAAV